MRRVIIIKMPILLKLIHQFNVSPFKILADFEEIDKLIQKFILKSKNLKYPKQFWNSGTKLDLMSYYI